MKCFSFRLNTNQIEKLISPGNLRIIQIRLGLLLLQFREFFTERKDFLKLLVVEFGDLVLSGGCRHFSQGSFAFEHVINFFLKGISGNDEPVNRDILLLTDAKSSVSCLIFNRRIPPQVVVNDGAGSGEI